MPSAPPGQRLPPVPRGLGGAVWDDGGSGDGFLSAAAVSRAPPALLAAAGARPLAGFLRGPEPALG